MKKNGERKERFLKTPTYIGGNKALKKLISENLQYPKAALENKVEGTVFLRYDIDYKGNVVGTTIKSGIGHGCDEEAIRLVKLLKFEVPKNRKLRVLFHKTIQIHFRLPKEKPAPLPQPKPKATTPAVQYNYVASPKTKPKPAKPKQDSGYSYTIRF